MARNRPALRRCETTSQRLEVATPSEILKRPVKSLKNNNSTRCKATDRIFVLYSKSAVCGRTQASHLCFDQSRNRLESCSNEADEEVDRKPISAPTQSGDKSPEIFPKAESPRLPHRGESLRQRSCRNGPQSCGVVPRVVTLKNRYITASPGVISGLEFPIWSHSIKDKLDFFPGRTNGIFPEN